MSQPVFVIAHWRVDESRSREFCNHVLVTSTPALEPRAFRWDRTSP